MSFRLNKYKQLPLIVALLCTGSALALTLLMTFYEQHWQNTQTLNRVSLQAEHLKATLEKNLSENLIILEVSESLLLLNPALASETLGQLVNAYTKTRPAIKRVTLTPHNNDSSVQTSSQSPATILQLSGDSLIAQKHLFYNKDTTTIPSYWGSVSLTIDVATLLPESLSNTKNTLDSFALREVNRSTRDSDAILGDPSVFSAADLLLQVTIPGGHWELGATSNKQLSASRWEITLFTIAGISGSVILGILAGLIILQWQKLHEKATIDALTRVFNRQTIQELGQKEVERARRYRHPMSLIMIDLDDFKAVNDDYGHLAGDKVLQSTAALIASAVRKTDLIGRFGGEEFIVILPESDTEDAATVAERIRANLNRTARINHGTRLLSASLGTATLAAADTFGTLFSRADSALYLAKSKGKNRVEAHSLPHIPISSDACPQI